MPKQPFGPEKISAAAQNSPDYKYERDHDPAREEEISKCIESPKQISFTYEGENVTIEYIEVPAKEKREGKEKTLITIPGFSGSYVPYTGVVKELAQYMGNCRVICISPLDSGASSSLKNSNLDKMAGVYGRAFEELGISPASSETTVIGHSRSDIIALELARSRPETVDNIVLVNGISANESNLPKLTYDFLKHVNVEIAPARIREAFGGEAGAAKNYWRHNLDFMKNLLNPVRAFNQFKSLAARKKINLNDLLSRLKANVLVLSATDELTDYRDVSEKVYGKLPEDVAKEHHIEVDGLHDEINAHPEALALKLKKWLESLDENK